MIYLRANHRHRPLSVSTTALLCLLIVAGCLSAGSPAFAGAAIDETPTKQRSLPATPT